MSQAFTPHVREILRGVVGGAPVAASVEKLVACSFTRETAEGMVRACRSGRTEWLETHVGWVEEV